MCSHAKNDHGKNALLFERSVVEQLFDEIDVSEKHTSATIALETKRVQSVTFRVFRVQKPEIGLPLVTDDLTTREATNGDDHGSRSRSLLTLRNVNDTKDFISLWIRH